MSDLTLQEIFDKCVLHFRTQRVASMAKIDTKVICAYRGDAGRKCAVGAFIADEFYLDYFETKGCSEPGVMQALDLSGAFPKDSEGRMVALQLYQSLQRIHDHNMPKIPSDTVVPLVDAEYNLKHLAEEVGLVYTPEQLNA